MINSFSRALLGRFVHRLPYLARQARSSGVPKTQAGGGPFKYQAGVGKVIKGWDQGCLGMKVGEKLG